MQRYPRHPIDSDTLLRRPASPLPDLAENGANRCGGSFHGDADDAKRLLKEIKRLQVIP